MRQILFNSFPKGCPKNFRNSSVIFPENFFALFLAAALALSAASCSDSGDSYEDDYDSSGAVSYGSTTKASSSSSTSSTYSPSCSDSSAQSVTYSFTNASGVTVTYHALYLIDGEEKSYSASDFTYGKVEASYSNEIAFLVINGGSLTLDGVEIVKSGDATTSSISDDAYNFYGLNDAVVAVGSGTSAILNGCTINSSAIHGNAVFATDDAEITVTGGIIIKNNQERGGRGFFASYGGSVSSTDGDVVISTSGNNSAALATDRGGGAIIVTGEGNVLSTQSNDSPCIYSTGTITVSGVTGTAAAAQAIVVEGKNQVSASGCVFTGARSGQGCVMLYQSMSGDASDSDASSSYTTADLTDCVFYNQFASSGEAMFYVTNTEAEVTESGCVFYAGTSATDYSSSYVLILCEENESNSWGTSGLNGGNITLSASGETLSGTLTASESDSSIAVTCGSSNLVKGSGSGTVTVNGSEKSPAVAM